MKIYIKNMVCDRCKMVVKAELEKLGFNVLQVDLGEVIIDREISDTDKKSLSIVLESLGFSLIDDKRTRTIEAVKTLIIDLVYDRSDTRFNLSDYISNFLHIDYNYISNLFSEVEGITIEKYYISQKVERVKELLVFDEISLSEIAFLLKYSSVAHLSSQFKKIVGVSPSVYKKNNVNERKSIDQI